MHTLLGVVIKTKEPLNQNDVKIEPICLPSSNKPITEGTQCFVSGWGKRSKQSKLQSLKTNESIKGFLPRILYPNTPECWESVSDEHRTMS